MPGRTLCRVHGGADVLDGTNDMNRSPAFQFYVNDWLSSPKISMMTPMEEGAYIRLLAYAWADPDVSIPDDDTALAQLSRLGEAWFDGAGTKVLACFVPHPKKPGKLVNRRLLHEEKKQRDWRTKSRKGGIQSGISRALHAKGGSVLVEPKPNSSSSSSSSSKKKKDLSSNHSLVQNNGHRSGFNIFWKAYPRKEGKGACDRWWQAQKPEDVMLGLMLSKISQAMNTKQWRKDGGQFVPMPLTWLNQKRWEDEISPESQHEKLPL